MVFTKRVQRRLAGIVCLALVCLMGSMVTGVAQADPKRGG